MAKLQHFSESWPKSLSHVVTYEIDFNYCRENGEFAPTAVEVPMGAVLAQNDKGQYVPFGAELSPAVEAVEASEGVQAVEGKAAVIADKACAILVSRKMAVSEEPQPCVVLARGACVCAPNLVWGKDVTDAQKKTALASLKALGIVPKE